MKKNIQKLFILILVQYIIPITAVSSQDEYTLNAIKKNDESAFTQGFEMTNDGELLLGTGLYGESKIGYLNIETGEFDIIDELAEEYFGEGITIGPDAVWQLTWKKGVAFKRDLDTLEVIDTANYEGEGWGLAYDSDRDVLWMSDGSSIIEKRDSETFDVIDEIEITFNGQPVESINELEYANGYIYANVWYTNKIVVINVDTGEIEYQYDLTELLNDIFTEEERKNIDTLNGIAHIEGNRFYITGKLYPVVFEIEFNR